MPTWDEDDSILVPGVLVTPVAGSASGSYTATEQGIINNLVTAVNALITSLKAANLIPED